MTDTVPPPPMALRTYRMLRLCSVGVIVLLAISIAIEYFRNNPNCLQGSISAYYFTGVQSVFVGALVALGLVMIVLWGKSSIEDGLLNLAGIVAPVVAFAPTGQPEKCGVQDVTGKQVTQERQLTAVVSASEDAISTNILSYLLVIAFVLGILLVVGFVAIWKRMKRPEGEWNFISRDPWAFWIPWMLAFALWVFGVGMYGWRQDWYYNGAHQAAAVTLFVFIILAVIDIGLQKFGVAWYCDAPEKSKGWACGYWALAAAMVVGAGLIAVIGNGGRHVVLAVEAWMIGWLAVFWLLQTWDRWIDGAPRLPLSPHESPQGHAPVETKGEST